MRKKLLSLLLCAALCLALLPDAAFAAAPGPAAPDGGGEPKTLASGSCGEKLSWKLDDTGRLTVSGTGAMYGYKDLDRPWYDYSDRIKSLVITQGVTSVGEEAFRYCYSLTSLTAADSVREIGAGAFLYCRGLKELTIPRGVSRIGARAFYGCSGLTELTIPRGVTEIGTEAFTDCDSLTAIRASADNPAYRSVDGVLFSKDGSLLHSYPTARAGAYTVPDGVERLGDGAFHSCPGLTGIRFPSTLRRIGVRCFEYCNALMDVVIPNGVTEIGDFAFSACGGLKSVSIGRGVKRIGDEAFAWCPELAELTLANGVGVIGKAAFLYCEKLESVTVPDSVTELGELAFAYCEAMTELSLGGGLQCIGDSCFCDSDGLTAVRIPASVTSIGAFAFLWCGNLREVQFSGPAPVIGEGCFEEVRALVRYPAGAAGWAEAAWQNYGGSLSWQSFTAAITAQPEDCVALSGTRARFTVAAEGEGLTYQWQVFSGGKWIDTTWYGNQTATLRPVASADNDGASYRCVVTDRSGNSLASRSATLELYRLRITSQPQDAAVPSGMRAQFTVEAKGEGLCYQWQVLSGGKWVDSTWLGNQTAMLQPLASSGNSGAKYRCVVTDRYGDTVTSRPATLELYRLAITAQPQDYSGPSGTRAGFTVTAQGEGLRYQWQVQTGGAWQDTDWLGNKTATLRPIVSAANNGARYRCVVTDGYGNTVTSEAAALHLYQFRILAQPQDYTGPSGERASFTVTAEGEELLYQWQVLIGGAWQDTDWRGNKTATLQPVISAGNNGAKYRCVVTDRYGSAAISETAALHLYRFQIIAQPQDYTGQNGERASFTVKAEGEGLLYQWQAQIGGTWQDTDWLGNKTATLRPIVSAGNNGVRYRCVVTDRYGSTATSEAATLHLYKLEITAQPQDYTGEAGTRASFTVAAQGDGLSYQWQVQIGGTWQDTDWLGNKTATLRPIVSAGNDGVRYRCVVSDRYGNSVTSEAATLHLAA